MKIRKTLLAAAIGGLGAAVPGVLLAQSSVQVYGTVHLSANSVKFGEGSTVAGVAGPGSLRKYGVTSHASNWGLRSTESLGGGMTAWFQAEFNMQMARTNGLNDGENTSRNSGVGLRGGHGNIYLGTWETPWAQTFRLWDVGTIGGWGPTTSIIGRREFTGTAPSRNCQNLLIGGAGGTFSVTQPICGNGSEALSGNAYALWRRYSYAAFYESPMFSGLQFKLGIQPNERRANVGITENPSAWSSSLTWTGMGGRARAFIANQRNKDWSTVGSTDSGVTFGGGYDFGVANVGATYETMKYKTAGGDSKAKQYGFGVAVPMGSGKIGASYARAKDVQGGSFGGDNGGKMWNIGYEWALSKRTAVGFGIAKIDNDSLGAHTWTGQIPNQNGFQSGIQAAGVDQTNIFVSMRHSF